MRKSPKFITKLLSTTVSGDFCGLSLKEVAMTGSISQETLDNEKVALDTRSLEDDSGPGKEDICGLDIHYFYIITFFFFLV